MTHRLPLPRAVVARNRRRTPGTALVALAAAVALLSGCTASESGTGGGVSRTTEPLDPPAAVAAPSDPAVVAPDAGVTANTALEVLGTLAVKGKAPATGYQRTAKFGAAWLDVDRNGCDTRNDILRRDLTAVTLQGACRVLSGTLANPYTGSTIPFVRGEKTSALVQIDHIVPLQNAWLTGAQQLTQAQRVSLANDPLNLLAVDARSNEHSVRSCI